MVSLLPQTSKLLCKLRLPVGNPILKERVGKPTRFFCARLVLVMAPCLGEIETILWLTPPEWEAVRLSLLVSLVAVFASLPLGIVIAWVLARKRFPGKTLVETIVNLPLVLPPVVTGYLLLLAFGQRGWIGQRLSDWFGIQLIFDWKGAAIAAAVVAFPLMVRSIRLAFSMIDPAMETAASNLGATRWSSFFRVTLPLARNGLIAGCVLAFARALGEFGATIMIAGNIPGETRTIPLFIYQILESPGGEVAAIRIVVVSVIISALALYFSGKLEKPSET